MDSLHVSKNVKMHWIESHKHVGVVVDVLVFGRNKWLYIIHLSISEGTVTFKWQESHQKQAQWKLGNIYDLTDYKFLNSKVEQNVVAFYSEKKIMKYGKTSIWVGVHFANSSTG